MIVASRRRQLLHALAASPRTDIGEKQRHFQLPAGKIF